jgi:hypothetical protein
MESVAASALYFETGSLRLMEGKIMFELENMILA